jgi:hypothetical protein
MGTGGRVPQIFDPWDRLHILVPQNLSVKPLEVNVVPQLQNYGYAAAVLTNFQVEVYI